jgi:hypothetical protein
MTALKVVSGQPRATVDVLAAKHGIAASFAFEQMHIDEALGESTDYLWKTVRNEREWVTQS